MNIVFIGPTGAGKSVQAQRIAEQFDLIHIVSGDLIRENMAIQTESGTLVKKYMDQGELVPDEVMETLVTERLQQIDGQRGFILDGYPRTRHQARTLQDTLNQLGRSPNVIIYLKVSDEEIIRRSEENAERTQARLKVFHRQAAPIIDYYRTSGKLVVIDGEGTIEQVHQALMETLEAVNRYETPIASREETDQIQALKSVSPLLSPEQATVGSLDLGLLGAPGSGKGTQAERLCQHLNLVHVATGNLFREHLKNQTELGKLAKTYMDRGELVPDDVTEAMVRERLSRPDTQHGFILDGFPRTLSQAEALTEIMTDMGRRLDAILYLKVSDDEIIKRLSGRMICRECQTPFHKIHHPFKTCPYNRCQGEYLYQRDDDKPETVQARLKTFHGQTAPLINYYTKAGLLTKIDGEAEASEITARMLVAIEALIVH